jgi:hypothetical protein
VVRLHDHGIHRLAELVVLEAERLDLLFRVHRVVDQGDGTGPAELGDHVVDAREGGLLDPAAVAGSEHRHPLALE